MIWSFLGCEISIGILDLRDCQNMVYNALGVVLGVELGQSRIAKPDCKYGFGMSL
jgi:hypothetical protein